MPLRATLVATYELGRQPFGLASPAAWLREDGVDVICVDTAVTELERSHIDGADLIAFHVPMHTATRLMTALVPRVRALNPEAHLCCYGLYAPLNADYLRKLGIDTLLGGEFEEGLVTLCRQLRGTEPVGTGLPLVSLRRQTFALPDRRFLPPLSAYAQLLSPSQPARLVGYTEASRGCKHQCRHCPIVPVYQGAFRVVDPSVVLEDIRQQVAAGAQHITFGDPDFFNGPGHAVRIVQALHDAFPWVTYDVTIKVSHLLQHQRLLPMLRDTGCAFVTTAVESVDDAVLVRLQKGHTVADFRAVVALCRATGLNLNPTFVAFTPWTTLDGYVALLQMVAELDLIGNVAPIQYAISMLLPAGSPLLSDPSLQPHLGQFDDAALSTIWHHPDPRMDALQETIMRIVREATQKQSTRREIFADIWRAAGETRAGSATPPLPPGYASATTTIPVLSEPWYC